MIRALFARASVACMCALLFSVPFTTVAQTTYDAQTLLPRVSLQLLPTTASFTEGSTFEVPLVLDTHGTSVNTLNVTVSYDATKLSIVKPTGGVSIIGLWLEPPSFDNTHGNATYVGAIPNGIVTSSGIVGTITFKAKALGTATVAVQTNSTVLQNDGFGSQAKVEYGTARYTIIPKASDGARIFSDTHPSQEMWYNNNSPVFGWNALSNTDGYSVLLDTKPNTIPDTVVTHTEPGVSFEKLDDGLWYLHVRTKQNGVWGNTGHYVVRIDTTPPARFKPEVNYVLAAAVVVNRTLVSFFTTDNLSGVDHYEIGVIDKASSITQSPIFIESESPYQLPQVGEAGAHVIVRAVDVAGNIRDEGIDISSSPSLFSGFVGKYSLYVLGGLLVLLILGFVLHYLYGHHIIAHIRRVLQIIKKEEEVGMLPTTPVPSATVPPTPPPTE